MSFPAGGFDIIIPIFPCNKPFMCSVKIPNKGCKGRPNIVGKARHKLAIGFFCLPDNRKSAFIGHNDLIDFIGKRRCQFFSPTALPLGNGNGNRKESSSISEKKRKKFIPPTLEDVSAYAKERGVQNLAQKFFDYYSAGNWVDGKGDPVRNWKQKFLTWESKEREKGTPSQPGKKPGYNVQHHGDELSDVQRAAIRQMMEDGA